MLLIKVQNKVLEDLRVESYRIHLTSQASLAASATRDGSGCIRDVRGMEDGGREWRRRAAKTHYNSFEV